jgi:hypothetical protein
MELGSGVSTLFLARAGAIHGFRVLSVDHDERWIRQVQSAVAEEELTAHVDFVLAPLEMTPSPWGSVDWYEPTALLAAAGNEQIDLLLVDGPPAYGTFKRQARYPAAPALDKVLADDAVLLLDDSERVAETQIASQWTKELGWQFDHKRSYGGLAVGRRTPRKRNL